MTKEEYMKYEPKAIKFARWLYSKRQLSLSQAEDDAHDVVTDLYFEPDPKWDTLQGKARQIAIIHRIRSRIKDKAKSLWTKQGMILTTGLSIDEAPKGEFNDDGDEENIETTLLSDGGKSAAQVRAFDEPGLEPPFVYLVRAEVAKLRGLKSKVSRATMRYQTIREALIKTKLYTRLFYAILKNLQPTFSQCLRARNEFFHPTL